MKEYTVGVRKIAKHIEITQMKHVTELLSELRDAEVEIPMVLHISADHRLKEVETCAVGSMMAVSVEARTIFAHAFRNSETDRSILLVHNHAFQKKAEPSSGDVEFTKGIRMASQILGIQLHDSVVMGTKEDFSFMEKGHIFEKASHYKATPPKRGVGFVKNTVVKPHADAPPRISSSKKAIAMTGDLRKWSEPTVAVVHMTPDMEPSLVTYYHPSKGDKLDAKAEAREILLDAILVPSTKYLVVLSNEWLFYGKQYEHASDRLRYLRIGATVMCLPVVDMIMVEKDLDFSFSEHGREFARSKVYITADDEGMKMKGPSKTRRADIPPYSWTFK